MVTTPRRTALFVTCIVDQIYPQVGLASADLLEAQGCEVHVPPGLTCCGQPAFNAGFRDDARPVAARTIEALRGQGDVVLPSGSCAAMIRHGYHELFQETPYAPLADELASRTYELTEYLVDVLGVTNTGAQAHGTIAIHDACHGLRELGLGSQARVLLGNVRGATVQDLPSCQQCCGFGGLFAVKQRAISEVMLDEKLADITEVAPDIVVTGDVSCLTQIAGGLSRAKHATRVLHIAEVLTTREEGSV